MNRVLLPAAVAVGMMITGARGNPSSGVEDTSQVDEVPTDWNDPLGGVEVPTLNAAERVLSFEVYVPKGMGTPIKVFTTPQEYVPEQSAVAILYDAPDYGRVVVIQHPPDVPEGKWEDTYQKWVSLNGQPDVSGTSEFVTIRKETKAFVTTSAGKSRSTVFWLDDGVEFIVMGPNLDRERALEVAQRI